MTRSLMDASQVCRKDLTIRIKYGCLTESFMIKMESQVCLCGYPRQLEKL